MKKLRGTALLAAIQCLMRCYHAEAAPEPPVSLSGGLFGRAAVPIPATSCLITPSVLPTRALT